jgi:cytochrome P450 family 110
MREVSTIPGPHGLLDRASPSQLPPGPGGPAWLNSLRYMRDPYRFYARIRARHGDLVTLPTLNGTVVLGCTPECARQILAGREEDFEVGFALEAVTSLVGTDSLLVTSGERHKRERRIMSPAFHGTRMRAYGPIAQRATQDVIAEWKVGTALAARPVMQRITLDVILRAVFGVQAAEEIAAFAHAIRRADGCARRSTRSARSPTRRSSPRCPISMPSAARRCASTR